MAYHRIEFWILYPGCTLGGCDSNDWDVDDSKNMCLCVDGHDRISGDEKGKYKMKKIINTAMTYLGLGLAAGVFYREFTKWNGFTGKTTLGVVHTHLLVLGVMFFLLVALFGKQEPTLLEQKTFRRFYILYNIALPFLACMMVVRGILQVQSVELTKSVNAMIAGFAGISHILMAIALFMFLVVLKKVWVKAE